MGPYHADRLDIEFSGVELEPDVPMTDYGMCNGAVLTVEGVGALLANSCLPLYRRLEKGQQAKQFTELNYGSLSLLKRTQISHDDSKWLTGICFLRDGIMICCVRNNTANTLVLVDTKPDTWRVQKVIFEDEAVTTPDSPILLGDGVLAISCYESQNPVRLYTWTSEDWENNPRLKLVARTQDRHQFDVCCACCEDSEGRIIVTDILHDRLVLLRRTPTLDADLPETLVVEDEIRQGLHRPCGLAVLPDDGIAVTEWAKSRVTVFEPVAPFAKRFSFSTFCDNPRAIAVDMKGCIVVSDYNNATLKVYERFAEGFHAGGIEVDGLKCDTVELSNLASVVNPMAVAINPEDGHLFVASSQDGVVVEIV